MHTTDPYPAKLKKRVHQLYYLKKKPMKEVVDYLKKEFPELEKRLNTDRMHSVARLMRIHRGLKAKNEKMSKRHNGNNGFSPEKRKDIIEAARKLRQKNYRWQAIREELSLQFPTEKIPPAGALATIVKGKQYKSKNGDSQYNISITGPSGMVMNMTVSSNKSLEKIIRHILEA